MEIIENSKEYLYDFIRLNEQWISKYFNLEEADHKLAADPFKIIENGGFVFCLVEDKSVLGFCTLFNEGRGIYELARMAVSGEPQGKGYGNLLLEECLSKVKELDTKKLYLVSNTRLESAISIYKKFGFKTIHLGKHPNYARANIIMELKLPLV